MGKRPPPELSRASVLNWLKAKDAIAQDASSAEVVRLSQCGVTDNDLRCLEYIPEAISLDLFENPITDKGLVHLRHLKQLRTLWLMDTGVTDNGLATLKELQSLEELYIANESLTDAGVRHLKGLDLKVLDLRFASVTDSSMDIISTFKRLEKLQLSMTKIGDAGLKQLSRLVRLKHLDLSGCAAITDAGIAALSSLTDLITLDLQGTKITDRSVSVLKQLCSLESLDVSPQFVSDPDNFSLDAAKQLVAALPRLSVTVANQIVAYSPLKTEYARVKIDGGTSILIPTHWEKQKLRPEYNPHLKLAYRENGYRWKESYPPDYSPAGISVTIQPDTRDPLDVLLELFGTDSNPNFVLRKKRRRRVGGRTIAEVIYRSYGTTIVYTMAWNTNGSHCELTFDCPLTKEKKLRSVREDVLASVSFTPDGS